MNVFDWLDAASNFVATAEEDPTRENLERNIYDSLDDAFRRNDSLSFRDAIESAGLLVLAED